MVNDLQQAIVDSLSERNLLNVVSGKTIVKIYACLTQSALTATEYEKLLNEASTQNVLNVIENRWEQLEGARQSLADAYEPLTAVLSDHPNTRRIAELVGEGRTATSVNSAIQKEVSSGHMNVADWPATLLRNLSHAAKVRVAEIHVGLLDQRSIGGR